VSLIHIAKKHNVCVVPYGGGTNVTEALRCSAHEERFILSVDMKGMNRILWIDPVNHLACIQAGAVGRNIMNQLAEHGFTLGHEPDSVEFSTLGGWIATNASGMKKNKYGNIEDIMIDVNLVTPQGVMSREGCFPRESIGLDPRRFILGSEGNLGIVSQAIVKIFPLPEVQKYDSILFHDFNTGVEFMYAMTRQGVVPASARLVDNLQFQFSQALKPGKEGLQKIKGQLEKSFVTQVKGFDTQQMVACTLVFEGAAEEVAYQQAHINRLAKEFKGMKSGSENGEKGYELTFSIAYIRDFVMDHYILAESFETSMPWSKAVALQDKVKQRVNDEHARLGLPGKPFVSCRLTQVYDTGCCIYFYLAFYYKDVENPSDLFTKIEHAARDEILKSGGSLSHHHGIGKLRQDFLPQIMSDETRRFNQAAKEAMDPDNMFGINNQGLKPDRATTNSRVKS
jgi:alkyldihydroxyacetonephosphate synthase